MSEIEWAYPVAPGSIRAVSDWSEMPEPADGPDLFSSMFDEPLHGMRIHPGGAFGDEWYAVQEQSRESEDVVLLKAVKESTGEPVWIRASRIKASA